MPLSWNVKIEDGVSAPAGRIAAALKAVDSEFKTLRTSAKAVDPLLSKLAGDFSKVGTSVSTATTKLIALGTRGADTAVSGLRKVSVEATATGRNVSALQAQFGAVRSSGGGGGFGGLRLFGSLYILREGLRLAKDAVEGVADTFSFVNAQVDLREAQESNLQVFLRSRDAAAAYRAELDRLADTGAARRQEVVGGASRLLGEGYNKQTTAADLKAAGLLVRGTANPSEGFDKIIGSIVRVRETGKLSDKFLVGLAQATSGKVSGDALTDAVSKALGKTTAQAKALRTSNPQLYLQLGLQGIAERSSTAAGGLRTVSELTKTLEDRWASLFETIDRSGFRSVLQNIVNLTSEDNGVLKDLRSTADATFNGILSPWLKDYEGSAGAQRLEGVLKSIEAVLKAAGAAASILSAELKLVFDSPGLRLIGKILDEAGPIVLAGSVGLATGGLPGAARAVTGQDDLLYDIDRTIADREHEKQARKGAAIGDILSNLKSGNLHIDPNTLPGHADGGLQLTPQVARIAEREPELIIPLSKIRDTFSQGQTGPGTIRFTPTITINVSGAGFSEEDLSQRVADVTLSTLQSAFEGASIQITGGI